MKWKGIIEYIVFILVVGFLLLYSWSRALWVD